MKKYNIDEKILVFKALSDNNRLQIIDILSCGEMCACNILESFNITQPTLSHHMKTLIDAKLVTSRKEANWIYYSLNKDTIDELNAFINYISSSKDDCICKNIN
ncbi:MAG: metalloregulator ArsR/SmtB family transcription factor [Bacilli bacterium]|nr:metalloregulator ArsR/SmtB family transcription factor [Bacilli bacterium]